MSGSYWIRGIPAEHARGPWSTARATRGIAADLHEEPAARPRSTTDGFRRRRAAGPRCRVQSRRPVTPACPEVAAGRPARPCRGPARPLRWRSMVSWLAFAPVAAFVIACALGLLVLARGLRNRRRAAAGDPMPAVPWGIAMLRSPWTGGFWLLFGLIGLVLWRPAVGWQAESSAYWTDGRVPALDEAVRSEIVDWARDARPVGVAVGLVTPDGTARATFGQRPAARGTAAPGRDVRDRLDHEDVHRRAAGVARRPGRRQPGRQAGGLAAGRRRPATGTAVDHPRPPRDAHRRPPEDAARHGRAPACSCACSSA